MKFPSNKNKIKNKKTLQKMFGASKLRRIKTSWKEKAIKKTEIKFIGKLSEKSKSILSPQKKKTSPKTLELQDAKTAKSTVQLIHDSIAEDTYSNPERQEMKRERLHEMKPKRKARWERSLVVSTPPKSKRRTNGGVNIKSEQRQ